jgi:chaperonin GroES
MSNITPLGERLLVKPADAVKEIGGIIIPQTAQEKPDRGTVLKLGELENGEWAITEGDKIMYAKGQGIEIEEEGQTLLLLSKRDLLLKY